MVGLYFLNQKFYLSNIKESIKETNIDPCIIKVKVWLDKYFNKENPCIKDIDIVDKKNILTQMKNLMDDHINRINVYYKNKEQRNQNYER